MLPEQFLITASGGYLDLHAWSHGLTRKPAVKTRGNITFERVNAGEECVIPTGTEIRSAVIRGSVIRLKTLVEAVMAVNVKAIDVLCEGEVTGATSNLGPGYFITADPLPDGISKVTNQKGWIVTYGADAEGDESLRLRIRAQFDGVSLWHTDARYRSIIAQRVGIDSDRIFFDHSKPRRGGSADALIVFNYEPSETDLKELNDWILEKGYHGHGDDLQIKAVPAEYIALSVSLRFKPTTPSVAKVKILAEITDFIRCAFRENSAYAGKVTQTSGTGIFSFSRLASELHLQFPQLLSVSFSQGDIVTELKVPRLQALTVSEAPNEPA